VHQLHPHGPAGDSATTGAYDHLSTYRESTGTIHLGFAPTLKDPKHAGEESPFEVTATAPLPAPCTVASPNVGFLDLDHQDWNFQTPGDTSKDQGNKYYQAGENDLVGKEYYRPVPLHELLHAFGLWHSASTTAFMNYGQRPWINRPPEKMVTPLPDDLAALRHLYPATGDVYSVVCS
jgi:hypothetical protein